MDIFFIILAILFGISLIVCIVGYFLENWPIENILFIFPFEIIFIFSLVYFSDKNNFVPRREIVRDIQITSGTLELNINMNKVNLYVYHPSRIVEEHIGYKWISKNWTEIKIFPLEKGYPLEKD